MVILETQTQDEQPVEGPSRVNVAQMLGDMAAAHPYRRAVVFPAGRDANGRVAYTHLTFRQLDRESDCLAHGLVRFGIRRGIRTILMVRPGLEFFALTFALFKVGAVPVIVDPGMGLKRMLSCLQQSRPAALVGIAPAQAVRVIFAKYFKSVKTHVTVGRRWFWGGPTLAHIRETPWQPFSVVQTREDETAAILFTTGSTGPAKGAVYTHGIFAAQVRHIQRTFNIQPGEIDLPTFPLFALFDPALGMTAVIPDMDSTRPARVNPDRIIEAVINQGVTNMFASPALLDRVGRFGQEKGIKLAVMRRVISAGAPVMPDNLERFSALLSQDAEIFPGYGATEAMPVAFIGSREILSQTRKLSEKGYGICVGRAFEGLDVRVIRITDDAISHWSEDLVCPVGEIGEIVVHGDIVTRAYFEKPRGDLFAKIMQDGRIWHRMGDLGWFDSEGRLWFCGRKSHRVVTPKHTYYTIPCESVYNNHPAVYRSALVGVGRKFDQKPVVCIELEKRGTFGSQRKLREELLEMGSKSVLTRDIRHLFFHPGFPVDIRHNAKIFREQLALWAEKKMKTNNRSRIRKAQSSSS